jgi:hypothetical protein
MDVKGWIGQTNIKAYKDRSLKPPPFPYIIIMVSEDRRGDDITNCGILEQNVTLELYSGKMDTAAEKKIENALDEIEKDYTKRRTWIDEEKMYMTVYTFYVIEKERK